MLDVPGPGLQNVDARIAGSNPKPTARVDQERTRRVAREGVGIRGIVSENRESIAGAVPTSDARVLDRYPQVVVRVLGDLVNEVAGWAPGYAGRVGVAYQLMAVVADQAIFGAEPHET